MCFLEIILNCLFDSDAVRDLQRSPSSAVLTGPLSSAAGRAGGGGVPGSHASWENAWVLVQS